VSASRRDPHLGELAAALVDGALDHGARDRALSHVTRCDECRNEVDLHRRLKATLAALAPPQPPAGLAERLQTLPDRTPAESLVGLPRDRFGARFRTPARMGGDGQVLNERLLATREPAARAVSVRVMTEDRPSSRPSADRPGSDRPGSDRPGSDRPGADRPGADRPASSRPASFSGGRGPGRSRSRRRLAATAAGGLAAFALSLATVAVIGGIDEPEPVAPPVGTFMVEHTRSTDGLPGTDLEVGVLDAGSGGR